MPYLLTSDQKSIYYEVHGEGKPIIFIHPPSMGLVTFEKQLPLAERYQIILFDIRGNGRSTLEKMDDVSMQRVSLDMEELVRHLELDEVTVCGYSNGCLQGLDFALSFPEQVKGLILVGAFSEVSSFILDREFDFGKVIASGKAINFLAFVLAKSHTKEKKFQKKLNAYVKMVDPNVLYTLYDDGQHYNCTNRLEEIKCPVQLIYGTRDLYIHHYKNKFKQNNENVIYISGVGHQIPTKKSNELNTIITKFMEKEQVMNEQLEGSN